jgi:integrase
METHLLEFTDTDVEETGDATVQFGILRAVMLVSYQEDPRWHRQTPYAQPSDWVFPSFSLKGRQPRVANMLVEDHLRLAAAEAGILSSHQNDQGVLVEDDRRRFGFHNLRHSLASFLVRSKTDPKTVQALLRHSDVKTTLQLYAHSVSEDRMTAQGTMLQAILGTGTAESGLRAD